jgi:hypothetical protein
MTSLEHRRVIILVLRKHGEQTRHKLLQKLFNHQMLHFDLDRALPELPMVITEIRDKVVYYRLSK